MKTPNCSIPCRNRAKPCVFYFQRRRSRMQAYVTVAVLSAVLTLCTCMNIDQSRAALSGESRVKRQTLSDEYDDVDSRMESLYSLLLARMAELSSRGTYPSTFSDVKRSSTGEISLDNMPLTRKRKVFWQPLGYLPASARIGNQGSSSGAAKDKNGSSIFRYGK